MPIDVHVKEKLGDIVLVKLEKKNLLDDQWYCRVISVTSPSGDRFDFPCYRWIANEKAVVLRDGMGESHPDSDQYPVLNQTRHKNCNLCVPLARLSHEDKTGLLNDHRRTELESRQQLFRFEDTVTILDNILSFGGVNAVSIFPQMF